MIKSNYIKICPKCGSIDTYRRTTVKGDFMGDHCMNCSFGMHKFTIFPEIEESLVEEFRKEIK